MTDALGEAVRAVLAGELIVIPTDTVYGICARPDSPEATARLFAAKDRPPELTLPVLVPSEESARRLAVFDERTERLVRNRWPGALTIVLARAAGSRGWGLGGDGRTIGLRLPDHPLARAVLERTGPLAATSANRSGEPPPAGCDGVVEVFGDLVSVYLCEEAPLGGTASTVVDLSGPEPAVLRAGAEAEEILRELEGGSGASGT